MEHVFLTNNSYIEVALRFISKDVASRKSYCFIDVDSYTTLAQLVQDLESASIEESCLCFLIIGSSMYSKVLAPVGAFRLDEGMINITRKVAHEKGYGYPEVMSRIRACQRLSMMTTAELNQAYLFAEYKSFKKMSFIAKLQPKTLYSRENRMAKKLGFSNSLQLRHFIHNEVQTPW